MCASTVGCSGSDEAIRIPSIWNSRRSGPRVRLSSRYASIAGRPASGDPSRRMYRTEGIVSPATGSMGSTRVEVPSLTASDVLEVPKSRPERTGWQLSARPHGGPPKPSLRDGVPPAWRPAPHRAGALGGPAVRPLARPALSPSRRSLDNGIDRSLDIGHGNWPSTRVRHKHRREPRRMPSADAAHLRGGGPARSGPNGHEHPPLLRR